MPVQQFEKLIANAEQSAQWWRDNQLKVNKVVRQKNLALSILHAGAVLLSFGMFAGGIWGGLTFTPSGPVTVLGFSMLAACAPLVTIGYAYARVKMERWWPKSCPHPDSEMGVYPALFHGVEASLDIRKNILQHIMGHSNEAVRAHVSALAQLQNLDLPDAWWKELQFTLTCIPNEPQISKTAQQQLDEVYVEIQQHTAHQNAPKVMKI